MTNIQASAPQSAEQQIAADLARSAARQPNMPLIRAAVALRHPELDEAAQDAMADRVAAEIRRAAVAVGFPQRSLGIATADLAKAAA